MAKNREKNQEKAEEKETVTPEQEIEETKQDGGEEETSSEKEEDPQVQWEAKVAELTDRVQRTMAEFDNYRKRTEKEKAARYEVGARSVIERMLPIIDNFERGLSTVDEEKKKDPFVDGMDKVYKQMIAVLEDMGVSPIEALGKEFDPSFHNAVMHTDDENVGENQIVEEFQKGYTYKGSVVRYSMVKVAN